MREARILVVEDDDDQRALVSDILRREDHAVTEAALLTRYTFSKYRNGNGQKDMMERIRFITLTDRHQKEMQEGVKRGESYARGTCLTRDLINEPAMVATPTKLADTAKKVATGGRISIKIFDPKAVKKMNMGALLGVAAGSDEPCRFVHMTYKCPGAKKTIANQKLHQ